MISFQATDDELAFVKMAKSFAMEKIRDKARDCENHRQVEESLLKEADELGFLSLELPESFSGMELPLITQAQIMKALSYGDLGIVQGLSGAGDTASVFRVTENHEGLQPLKKRYANDPTITGCLVDLSDTGKPWAKSVTVKQSGSDLIINGTTEPVRLANQAEIALVFARDDQDDAVVLLLDEPEWTVLEGEYRLGLLAAGVGRIQFTDVFVPVGKVLARGVEAESVIRTAQTRNYILQAAKQNGVMEAALDYATEYTASRKAFGQEIAKFQGVSFKIAKMAMETRIVNHLIWEAAVKADERSNAAYRFALRALHRAHRGSRFVTDAAVQLLGGHGFIQEFPVEKWMRDTQAQVALYGREQELLTRIGEELLTAEMEVKTNDFI
jgi:acyl-CoA dehydrogenase